MADDRACPDCKVSLVFDPDLVGETCGGLTLRGWDVCPKCSTAWLAPKGMAVVYEGTWKLSSGSRSVETGNGRIRVDGCSNAEALMKRIVDLPALELRHAAMVGLLKETMDVLREAETAILARSPASAGERCKELARKIEGTLTPIFSSRLTSTESHATSKSRKGKR